MNVLMLSRPSFIFSNMQYQYFVTLIFAIALLKINLIFIRVILGCGSDRKIFMKQGSRIKLSKNWMSVWPIEIYKLQGWCCYIKKSV